MKTVTKLGELINCMNEAPSGAFVGITDYIDSKGRVTSITGHLGFNYSNVSMVNINRLTKLIEAGFEAMTINGQCRWDTENNEWNSAKRSMPMDTYTIDYSAEHVQACAVAMLEKMKNPKKRTSNNVNMTEKENGLSLNTTTKNFNFMLLVENTTYKADATAKEQEGKVVKPKAKMPMVALQDAIKKLYIRKVKSFTIAEGKFAKITINKQAFYSDSITL